MRRRWVLGAAVALVAAGVPAAQAAWIGHAGSDPKAGSAAIVAAQGTGTQLAGGAVLDPDLEAQLAAAGPEDRLTVFVHGTSIEAASAAVDAADLVLLTTFDQVGVAVVDGRPAEVLAAGTQPGVTYLEGSEPWALLQESSHTATRGEEALAGFTVTSTEPVLMGDGRPHPRRTRTVTHTAPGVDGSGVSIAVIDSGIDGTHPAFALPDGGSRVVRNMKFTQFCPVALVEDSLPVPCSGNQDNDLFVDVPTNDSDTPSAGGHGTHVSGIAGGGYDAASGVPIHGAAPGSRLVGLSVGFTLAVYGSDAALNWVLEHHAAPCGEGADPAECPPIRVANLSLGPVGGGEFDPAGVTAKLQQALVDAGVIVVWAAGNEGGDGSTNTTNPPGQDPTPGVLMVANYDDGGIGTRDGSLNPSSSRGDASRPETWPDLAAPGTAITSACRVTLPICQLGEGPVDDDYWSLSGTSMAAPHIAGIVAQLFEAAPDATPAEIEDALEDTAYPFAVGAAYSPDPRNPDHGSSFDKGHGLVDVVGAIGRLLGFPGESTVPAEPVCANPLVVDPAGDASHPSTDLTALSIEGDAAAGLTFTIAVDDLTDGYPEGANGTFYDVPFTVGGGGFYVSAGRSQFGGVPPADPAQPPTGTDGESFDLGRRDGNLLENFASLQGSFDAEANRITIRLTQADVDEANVAIDEANAEPGATPIPNFPDLVDGLRLSTIGLNSSTTTDALLVSAFSADDSAAAACDLVVGAGPAPAEPPPPPPEQPPAPPADANLGDDDTFEASGSPPGDTIEHTCSGPEDPACIPYVLVLDPSTGSGELEVAISAGNPVLDDFDLVLYDAAGNEVGVIGNPATLIESGTFPVASAGTYTLVVQPYFATTASTYTVSATLRAT